MHLAVGGREKQLKIGHWLLLLLLLQLFFVASRNTYFFCFAVFLVSSRRLSSALSLPCSFSRSLGRLHFALFFFAHFFLFKCLGSGGRFSNAIFRLKYAQLRSASTSHSLPATWRPFSRNPSQLISTISYRLTQNFRPTLFSTTTNIKDLHFVLLLCSVPAGCFDCLPEIRRDNKQDFLLHCDWSHQMK